MSTIANSIAADEEPNNHPQPSTATNEEQNNHRHPSTSSAKHSTASNESTVLSRPIVSILSLDDENISMLEIVRDNNGNPLTPDLYRIRVRSMLPAVLLDYFQTYRLLSLFQEVMEKQPSRSCKNDVVQCQMFWDIKKRPSPAGDMYWISPSNIETHQQLLSYVSYGGLGEILKAIGSIHISELPHLTVYSLTFILVSRCDEVRLHSDNDEELSGEVFTIMIPLVLIPDSDPELVILQQRSQKQYHIKYSVGEALVWGPLTVHSTAKCNYKEGTRICLAINLGYINEHNVKQVTLDFTQKYPPRSTKLLLEWAKRPHWTSKLPSEVALPTVSDECVLGKAWFEMYQLYLRYNKSHGVITDSNCPSSLRQWISTQRLNYSKKHQVSKNTENYQYAASAARSMTNAREETLRVVGFVFSNDRDAGKNQHNWELMLGELKQFMSTNGHLNVKAKDNEPLYTWVRRQRKTLTKKTLTVTQKERKKKLSNLGFNF